VSINPQNVDTAPAPAPYRETSAEPTPSTGVSAPVLLSLIGIRHATEGQEPALSDGSVGRDLL
jgi:hypothetical protein